MLSMKNSDIIRMPVDKIRQTGRAAQGVKLVALAANATVRAAARILQETINGDE